MRRLASSTAALLLVLLASVSGRCGTRGADELFWVPTFEQALEMAAHTQRPILLLYYTLVGKESPTYSGPTTVC